MEIDDMLLPESMLLGAPQFAAPKIDDPEAIAAAGKKRIEGLVKSSKGNANGTPRVIVLCLSGLRCADVVRDLRSIKGKGEVAKVSDLSVYRGPWLTRQLFAKHMKVPEQVNYLHMTRVSIAVGTPARIAKLITEGKHPRINIQLDSS
jgi:protein CMS1